MYHYFSKEEHSRVRVLTMVIFTVLDPVHLEAPVKRDSHEN